GYGNELRRDDGVGPRLARLVAAWDRTGVRALAVQQLTPELAEDLAGAERAVFVDADASPGEVLVLRALRHAGGPGPRLGPFGAPRELLALTGALFGRQPTAWLLTIPVEDLRHGEGLSPTAERGLGAALRQVAALANSGARAEESAGHAR